MSQKVSQAVGVLLLCIFMLVFSPMMLRIHVLKRTVSSYSFKDTLCSIPSKEVTLNFLVVFFYFYVLIYSTPFSAQFTSNQAINTK